MNGKITAPMTIKKRLRRPEKGEAKLNRMRLNLNRRWVRILDVKNATLSEEPLKATEGDQTVAGPDCQTE
jgi:hypothetical protein